MRKNFALPLALSSLAILAACNTSGSTIDTDTDQTESLPAAMESMSEAAVMTEDSVTSEAAVQTPSEAPVDTTDTGVVENEASIGTTVIDVAMTDWEFAPTSVSAEVGEKLVFRVTGVEGKHSFAIADLGINVPVEVGETVDVAIPTDKAGTFQFRCRIPCGPGHKDMVGTLVIS